MRGAEDGGKDPSPPPPPHPAILVGHRKLMSEVVKSRSRVESITERCGNSSSDTKDSEKYHGGVLLYIFSFTMYKDYFDLKYINKLQLGMVV